jgi:hypothetical protein
MATADKYGYGEIGAVNIATDTTKVSASGQYSSDYTASKAINTTPASGNKGWISPAGSSNAYLDYDFGEDVSIKSINIGYCASSGASTTARYKIQGKKNGSSEWVDLTNEYTSILLNQWIKLTPIVSDTFRYYRLLEIERAVGGSGWVIQYCKYQPLGNVPIMTANNAPYGTASASNEASGAAWKAFDGIDSTPWYPSSDITRITLTYNSINPIKAKRAKLRLSGVARISTLTISGSFDNSTWTPIYTDTNPSSHITDETDVYIDLNSAQYYPYHMVEIVKSVANSVAIYTLQFYGRELPVKQASAPTDGREYVQIGSDYYTEDWGEKDFATGSTRKTIYDHGVELETLTGTSGAEKNNDNIYIPAANGISTPSIDMTPYDMVGVVVGKKILVSSSGSYIGIGTETAGQANAASYSSGFSRIAGQDMPYNVAHDISSMSESKTVTITSATGVSDYLTIDEIWLE